MKKTKKLGIWEVWNEYVAESVYIDHKPTEADIIEILEFEEWPGESELGKDWKKYIHVYKQSIYVK